MAVLAQDGGEPGVAHPYQVGLNAIVTPEDHAWPDEDDAEARPVVPVT